MATKLALLTCLASTLFMTGLIWFVQVVHYPLFDRIGNGSFAAYHAAHVRSTTAAVVVPMALELATSLALAVVRPAGVGPWLAWSGLTAATAAWLATALLSVPLHDRLGAGFDVRTHAGLVSTNWARTVAWTVHSAIVLAMAARSMR